MVSFGKCFVITTLGGTEDNTVWKNLDLNDRVETIYSEESDLDPEEVLEKSEPINFVYIYILMYTQ